MSWLLARGGNAVVEQSTHNPKLGGSNPASADIEAKSSKIFLLDVSFFVNVLASTWDYLSVLHSLIFLMKEK